VIEATNLPFRSESFDVVIANNYNGQDGYLPEIHRTLKENGRIFLSWTEMLSLPFVTSLTANECRKENFKQVKIRPGAPSSVIPGVAWNWYVQATK